MLLLLFVTASCASKKFNTTITQPDRPWSCESARFRIAGVDPLAPDEFFITGYTDSDYWFGKVKNSGHMKDLARDLQEKACSLYPDIFSQESDALPLYISMVTHSYKNSSVLSSFTAALSWGVFGVILPLPLYFSCDYEVIVSCPDVNIIRTFRFKNKLTSWISFPSPLALIPVPGHADKRALGMYPYQSSHYTGKQFILDCFTHAIVQALYSVDCTTLSGKQKVFCSSEPSSEKPLSCIKKRGLALPALR